LIRAALSGLRHHRAARVRDPVGVVASVVVERVLALVEDAHEPAQPRAGVDLGQPAPVIDVLKSSGASVRDTPTRRPSCSRGCRAAGRGPVVVAPRADAPAL
jgi:hypothetical protein